MKKLENVIRVVQFWLLIRPENRQNECGRQNNNNKKPVLQRNGSVKWHTITVAPPALAKYSTF